MVSAAEKGSQLKPTRPQVPPVPKSLHPVGVSGGVAGVPGVPGVSGDACEPIGCGVAFQTISLGKVSPLQVSTTTNPGFLSSLPRHNGPGKRLTEGAVRRKTTLFALPWGIFCHRVVGSLHGR